MAGVDAAGVDAAGVDAAAGALKPALTGGLGFPFAPLRRAMAKSPRTPGEGLYKLHSTEWSVNFIGFALMGVALFGLVAALQQVLGANLGTTATNAVFLGIIVLLLVFYQRIYTTRASVKVDAEGISIEIYKLFGTQRRSYPWPLLNEIGRGTQKGMSGLWAAAEKHYVMLRFAKGGAFGARRYFFYESGSFEQVAQFYGVLRYRAPQVPENKALFGEK